MKNIPVFLASVGLIRATGGCYYIKHDGNMTAAPAIKSSGPGVFAFGHKTTSMSQIYFTFA